jgi:hypothetical protein
MAYLTVSELKNCNVIDEIKNVSSEEEIKLQSLIQYCSSLIDSYVGFSFVKEEDITLYEDGDGNNLIALTKRILEIKSITTTKGTSYNTNNTRIIGNKHNKILNVEEDFEDGVLNLVIVGDFGWESVPLDVVDCLIILCNGNYNILNDGDTLEKLSGPFQQERIGDYSYTLTKRQNSITGDNIDTTGNIQVDQILDKYRSNFSIGVV